MNQLVLITEAGEPAALRFLEFFAALIAESGELLDPLTREI